MTTPTLGRFWNGYSWKVMPERIASVAEVLPARPRKTDRDQAKVHADENVSHELYDRPAGSVFILSRGAVAHMDGIDQPSDLETLDTAATHGQAPIMPEFNIDPLPCAECAKVAPKLCATHAEREQKRRDRREDETPPSSPRPMREG